MFLTAVAITILMAYIKKRINKNSKYTTMRLMHVFFRIMDFEWTKKMKLKALDDLEAELKSRYYDCNKGGMYLCIIGLHFNYITYDKNADLSTYEEVFPELHDEIEKACIANRGKYVSGISAWDGPDFQSRLDVINKIRAELTDSPVIETLTKEE